MPRRGSRPSWTTEQRALLALAAVSVVLATLIVLPYLQYVLAAVVLAYVLVPAQSRLERRVGRNGAALGITGVVVLGLIVPSAYVLLLAFRQGLALLRAVRTGAFDVDVVERRLQEVGVVVDLGDLYATYQGPITDAARRLATGAFGIVSGLPNLFIGLTVTLFVLFALLRDRRRLLSWLQRVIPLRNDVQREFLGELDRLMWASVVGNVAVAAIQAVLLTIGLFLLDAPSVVFLGVATFALCLLPLVGAFGVWIPVSLYFFAVGRPTAAAALVVFGSLISILDNYLRPAVIGHSGALDAATIVVGIFGGVVVFGVVGVFVGPVVLGGAKVALDLYAREGGRGPPRFAS